MAELRFPIRDPDDELATDLGDVIRQAVADGQLTDTEASIAREIRTRLVLDGARTSEDAVERLERLGPAGQRQWLDEARIACGLPSATELEQRREDALFESALARVSPPPPPEWDEMQRCPECGRYPTENGGAWRPVSVERWWCEEHKHLAEEGDLEEHVAPYFLGVNGRLIPSEREAARIAKWHREREESEERERELREQHLEAEAQALDAVRQRHEETAVVSVAGYRVHPNGRIVNL
jgi:hypothetical protein